MKIVWQSGTREFDVFPYFNPNIRHPLSLWRHLKMVLLYSTNIIAKKKLNPLRVKWPMEPAVISSFCGAMRMTVFDSPLEETLAFSSFQQILVLISLPQKDGKLS